MGNLLQYNEISLQPIEYSDLENFRVWRNNKENIKYFREYRLLNKYNQDTWFERVMSDDKQVNFSIKHNNDTIGHTGLYYIDWRNRNAEFGIYIGDKTHIGKGYATISLKLLLEYGFNVLNLRRVWCEVYDNNNAKSLYEKIGFKNEGIMRDTYFWNGEYYNSHILSMLSDEFYGVIKETNEGDNGNPIGQ